MKPSILLGIAALLGMSLGCAPRNYNETNAQSINQNDMGSHGVLAFFRPAAWKVLWLKEKTSEGKLLQCWLQATNTSTTKQATINDARKQAIPVVGRYIDYEALKIQIKQLHTIKDAYRITQIIDIERQAIAKKLPNHGSVGNDEYYKTWVDQIVEAIESVPVAQHSQETCTAE